MAESWKLQYFLFTDDGRIGPYASEEEARKRKEEYPWATIVEVFHKERSEHETSKKEKESN